VLARAIISSLLAALTVLLAVATLAYRAPWILDGAVGCWLAVRVWHRRRRTR
jgi:hypothetical protein